MNAVALKDSPYAEVEELFDALERAKRAATKRKIVEELSERLALQAAGEDLFDADLLETLAREMIAAQVELMELDEPAGGPARPGAVTVTG
jgi:hypothetical protein